MLDQLAAGVQVHREGAATDRSDLRFGRFAVQVLGAKCATPVDKIQVISTQVPAYMPVILRSWHPTL